MKYTFFFLLVSLIVTGCSREDDAPQPEQTAGKGGTGILKITPKHHGNSIDSCTLYIKYNTQDIPSSYDDSVKVQMENGKPVATFGQLKKGQYYLFGQGWDPSINSIVKGGIPYTIVDENTLELSIPVTEGD